MATATPTKTTAYVTITTETQARTMKRPTLVSTRPVARRRRVSPAGRTASTSPSGNE